MTSHRWCEWKVRVWDGRNRPQPWSPSAHWSMGLLDPHEWKASWIGRDDARAAVPGNGNDQYLPATHVRKDFVLRKEPRRALLYVTSLGVVEPRLNGEKVGDDFLIPGWTDYHKRVYYRAYEVTSRVRQGQNTLGAILGDGWFRGHLSIIGQNLYGRRTRLLAQLHVFYADGSSDIVVSDRSWTAGFGPILAADLYAGETYDARLGVPGWDRPGFTHPDWCPVQVGTALDPWFNRRQAPIERTGEIRPLAITRPRPGLHVVDFGRNFAGWMRLRITAAAGTKITMRFGEMLNADGSVYQTNLRGARATDTYICRGARRGSLGAAFHLSWFSIRRSGRTARAAESGDVHRGCRRLGPAADRFVRLFGRHHDPHRGQHALHGPRKPSRYPHGLSAAATSAWGGWIGTKWRPADLWEQDASSLLTKWMGDIVDARLSDGGFSMIAPMFHRFAWSPGWADSGVLIPWTMYRVYGDTRLCERYYRDMAGHIDYYQRHSTALIGPDTGLVDWLAPDMSTPQATHFHRAIRPRGAGACRPWRGPGKDGGCSPISADCFRTSARRSRRSSFTPTALIGTGSQGGMRWPWLTTCWTASKSAGAADHLVAAIDARGGHLSTGMVTTHLSCPALSKVGPHRCCLPALCPTTYPSWGYFLKMGATSMWERWDAKTEQGFHPEGMNSFNHANLGTCTEWFYRTVLGIDSEGPGFKTILIKPIPGGKLTWAKGHYDSPQGRIAVAWSSGGRSFELTSPSRPTRRLAWSFRARTRRQCERAASRPRSPKA